MQKHYGCYLKAIKPILTTAERDDSCKKLSFKKNRRDIWLRSPPPPLSDLERLLLRRSGVFKGNNAVRVMKLKVLRDNVQNLSKLVNS